MIFKDLRHLILIIIILFFSLMSPFIHINKNISHYFKDNRPAQLVSIFFMSLSYFLTMSLTLGYKELLYSIVITCILIILTTDDLFKNKKNDGNNVL